MVGDNAVPTAVTRRQHAWRLPAALYFIAGVLIASGLWLCDELLTLAMYCGKACLYPIPLVGTFGIYAAEGIAWAMVLAGVSLIICASYT